MALEVKIPEKKYNCTQSELYTCATLGWANYGEHQAEFSILKPKYTVALQANMFVEIAAAHTLPSALQRSDFLETFRMALETKAKEALIKWQYVKTYIMEAYPKDLHKSKLSSAGADYYKKAAFYNWDYLENLLKHALDFINNNTAQLQANNNMPAAFPAQFSTLRSEIILAIGNFKMSEQNNEIKTADKITANNIIYDELLSMFKDGQLIFKNSPKIKEKFIFEQVLELVRGSANVIKSFNIPANSSKTIKKVVANSVIVNIGEEPVLICSGSNECNLETGTILGHEQTLTAPDSTITITNNNNTEAVCTVRVVKK